ncbi:hypothetical protein BDA99DRAFT_539756 [Phascolomyces articulosus]|uniref:Uncharacterized protein n=1 Tax=Phascolomyces articulosus TaxID=60185 RepID=A0AAD5JVA2_9FUNG|nr:hypothetical protein BDA99DRAFT_539756 [Phascolomyces articulosus]
MIENHTMDHKYGSEMIGYRRTMSEKIVGFYRTRCYINNPLCSFSFCFAAILAAQDHTWYPYNLVEILINRISNKAELQQVLTILVLVVVFLEKIDQGEEQ